MDPQIRHDPRFSGDELHIHIDLGKTHIPFLGIAVLMGILPTVFALSIVWLVMALIWVGMVDF